MEKPKLYAYVLTIEYEDRDDGYLEIMDVFSSSARAMRYCKSLGLEIITAYGNPYTPSYEVKFSLTYAGYLEDYWSIRDGELDKYTITLTKWTMK